MMEDRLARLAALKEQREIAVERNFKSVKEEAQKRQINYKEKERIDRKAKHALKLKEKKEASEKGIDYERETNLNYTAEEVQQWEAIQKQKKKAADPGFSDYAQMAERKYKKQMKEFKPDLLEYVMEKNKDDNSNNNNNSTTIKSNYPSLKKIDELSEAVKKQMEERQKFSRRRPHNDEEDVNYINDRNQRFNQKIARFYDKYTQDIKDSLERGTA